MDTADDTLELTLDCTGTERVDEMLLILGLDKLERETLILRYEKNLTYQQMSEVLQLPVMDVQTRVSRAKKILRHMLREKLGRC